MKLNIRAQTAQNQHNNSPIVLVHGLFGSLDNLGVLARDLVNDHNIIQVDMRNHSINAVSESDAQTRQQAAAIMRQHLNEEGVIQFLLKSFVDGEWRFNVPVLWDQYPHIVGWEKIPAWDHPALFIPGGNSPYVSEQYRDDLLAQFPQARAHVIAGAGHWVHAEKPDAVLRAIRRYLND